MSTMLGEKDALETKPIVFDFSAEMDPGVAMTAVVIDVELLRGTDPTPAAIKQGSPVISGQQAIQLVTGGVLDAEYHLRGRATGADGLVHVISGDMRVVHR